MPSRRLKGPEPPDAERRLRSLGLVLPRVPEPVGHFELGVVHGNLLFLSGQGPVLEDGTLAVGRVGHDVDVETAYMHARRAGLVLLAAARKILGDLDRVARIVRLLGLVNADARFDHHPRVIDGCSDLMHEIFGINGQHARSAIGVASLPGGITVEIEAVFAVRQATPRLVSTD